MTTAMTLSLNSYEVKKEMKESVHKLDQAKDNLSHIFSKHLGDSCVSEVVYRFINSRENDKTKESYETNIRQFFNWINIDSIDDVTLVDLNNINYGLACKYKKYLEENFASNTVKQKKNTMQTLFNYINVEFKRDFDIDMFGDNPFSGIVVKDKDSKKYGDYTNEEIKRIFKNTYRSEDKLTYLIALSTGLRIDEILNLNIKKSFTRLSNGMMCVVGRGKHDVEFLHGITEDMYTKCLSVAEKNNNDGYLFKGMSGMTNGCMLKRLHTTLGYIGITPEIRSRNQRYLCLHSFRKCTASLVYDITGGNMRAIQEVMGHSSVTTSEKHYDVLDKESRMRENLGEAIERKLFSERNVVQELSDALSGLEGYEVREKLMNGLNESEICKIIDVLNSSKVREIC